MVFMFIAVTGLLLVFYLPLGLGTELKAGSMTDSTNSISIDKVLAITMSQNLPGITSSEDIFRIEFTPSQNVYRSDGTT